MCLQNATCLECLTHRNHVLFEQAKAVVFASRLGQVALPEFFVTSPCEKTANSHTSSGDVLVSDNDDGPCESKNFDYSYIGNELTSDHCGLNLLSNAIF
uniref:Uncharacterized protein n=1 Tax=Ditylenchus dipsaci TaxID=166011 RepID=A0A915D3F1_9BILA